MKSLSVGADRGGEGELVVFFGGDESAEGFGARGEAGCGEMDLVAEHVPAEMREDVVGAAEGADVQGRGIGLSGRCSGLA